jgi:lipoic acid synthetase
MVGLGETFEELRAVLADLAAVGVGIVTIGQYLRPSGDHLPVARYYAPEEFLALKSAGLALGLRHVESGPLVRSSYHAHEQAAALRD